MPKTTYLVSRCAVAWDPAFLMAYMKQLEAQKPVIFCGDFNVAHTATRP
jgi:exonuclease III